MKIRTECPKKNNKYYNNKSHGGLSDAVNGYPMISGLTVLDNCVGWANSRFNEIINDPNLDGLVKKFKYQLVCDAEDFIESAKRQGLKINPTPIEGGIMVWQKGATLSSGDGAGHVAVVERVYDDGTILTSESGWASWAFKTVRRDNNNGRWGQNSAYKFRGCIINPAVTDPKVVPVPPLNVDGIGGACTVRAMQRFFGTLQDGVLSGQNKNCAKYYPALKAVEYGKGGSTCVKKMQSWLGITSDGVWGQNTSKALQKKLGVEADGIFGANSVKALQKFLNKYQKVTDVPAQSTPSVEPEKKAYNFIDVSDWQSKIDWAKVKAAGIDGAIIRYADGTTLDKRFAENMAGAINAGLHVGSYIFSRAKTKAEAEKEAERLFNACKPYKYDMPLYIDLEVSTLAKYADTVAAAFLNKMAALGARGGVYANLNWWNNYLTKTAKNYSASAFWIAQYNDTMDYKPAERMGMWQYTSSGSVNGISGKVDRDKCYVAYWKKETDPGGKEPEPENPKTYNGEMPKASHDATIKVADLIKATCEDLAFPYGTPDSKTKYGHAKDYKITKYDADRPTQANKNAFDKIFPKHWSWGSEKYGYGQRVNACCDDAASLVVRFSGAAKDFSHALDYLAKGKEDYDNFTKVKYKSKSQLIPGSICAFKRKSGTSGHVFIVYSKGRKCDAGLNNRYLGIRDLNKSYYNFDKTVDYGYVYQPKDKYITVPRGYIGYGEKGDEVLKLQKFVNWYYGKKVLAEDGLFGSNTLKYFKQLQTDLGITADGKCSSQSIAAMSKAVIK